MRFTSLFQLVVWLLLMAALPAELGASPLQRLEIPPLQKPGAEDEQRVRMEKEMAKKAAQARQAEMKRDTEKLLKLASRSNWSFPRAVAGVCDWSRGGAPLLAKNARNGAPTSRRRFGKDTLPRFHFCSSRLRQ